MAKIALNKDQTVVQLVKDSCRELMSVAKDVKINKDALTEFARTLDASKVTGVTPRRFPLKFDSASQEINLLSLMAMLNFGSGFRLDLAKHCGRGAFETIQFGVLGMFLTRELNADYMVAITLMEVSSLFGLPIDEEFELSPAIHSTRAHVLRPLADFIRKSLNQSGAVLRAYQCRDFADFIFQQTEGRQGQADKKSSAEQQEASVFAHELVYRLVSAFPAFADKYELKEDKTAVATVPTDANKIGAESTTGQTSLSSETKDVTHTQSPSASVVTTDSGDGKTREVWLLKKAQLLASDLQRRFHREDARFNFSDAENLTIFADNVVPAMLRHLGILVLSPQLSVLCDEQRDLSDRYARQEAELRAAAVIACEEIVASVNARLASDGEHATVSSDGEQSRSSGALKITARDLDHFLWKLGKSSDETRKYPRHVARNTSFY